MMTQRDGPTLTALGVAMLVSLAWGSAASAGPVWDEASQGDAGSSPDSAQQDDGSGPVSRIQGELEGAAAFAFARGFDDFEDMYIIRICDPMGFKASTVGVDGGDASFNTQLWLFRPDPSDPLMAHGLLGNDNTAIPPSLFSRLLPDPTDGGPSLIMPGIYYLAISGFDDDPESAGGDIFFQLTPTEISGADGPGGAMPLTGWADGIHAAGTYEIALTGVTYPTQATVDCNGNNVHDMCDIYEGTSTDINMNKIPDECEADIDGDGDVDVQDLLLLLGAWGPCPVPPPPCPADINGDGSVDVLDLLFLLSQWS